MYIITISNPNPQGKGKKGRIKRRVREKNRRKARRKMEKKRGERKGGKWEKGGGEEMNGKKLRE